MSKNQLAQVMPSATAYFANLLAVVCTFVQLVEYSLLLGIASLVATLATVCNT